TLSTAAGGNENHFRFSGAFKLVAPVVQDVDGIVAVGFDRGAGIQLNQAVDVVRSRRDLIVETESNVSLFKKVLSRQMINDQEDHNGSRDGPPSEPIRKCAGEHDKDGEEDNKAGCGRKLKNGVVFEYAEDENDDKDQNFYGDEVKVILVEYLDDRGPVVEIVIFHLADFKSVEKIVDTDLPFARDVQLFHGACPRYLHLLFEFFIDAAHDILEDVLVREPEVSEEGKRHNNKAGQVSGYVHSDEPR